MKRYAAIFFALTLLLLSHLSARASHPDVRIKDLADVEGVRSNQLVGFGFVMGF